MGGYTIIYGRVSRRFLMALLAATALSLPSAAHAATLADSVTQAVTTHPTAEAGKAGATAASKALWEEKSGFFPTVNVTANAGREHSNNSTSRGLAGPQGATSWVDEGGVTVSQPLFAGFGVVSRVRAAEDRLQSAQYALGGTGEDLALRAARAHLNLMRTKELLALADGYYKEIQSRHDKIGLMVKEGAAEEAEALQGEDVLMAAKNTRLGYEEAFHQAEADYIEVVGKQPDETLEFGGASWDGLVPPSVDEAIRAAMTGSPRLMSADRAVSALGHDEAAARADLFPHVSADVNYDRKNQRDPMGGNSEDASGLIRMSWNFSTGGGQFAHVQRSAATRAEALAKRHAAARDVEHDVRQKFTSMKIVDEQFGLLVSREEAVGKILGSSLKQFEAGKQSNLQIISAHAKLFDARAARADAYYRKLLSRFELLNAMGKLREAFAPQVASAAGN
jgi:adhesin transport system outer membrane protein